MTSSPGADNNMILDEKTININMETREGYINAMLLTRNMYKKKLRINKSRSEMTAELVKFIVRDDQKENVKNDSCIDNMIGQILN